jgi:malate dehydrogenase (oxaloacetate-decarboxylating)(NADP+)
MICGMVSTTHPHLHFIDQVMGKKKVCNLYAAMNALCCQAGRFSSWIRR